MRSLLASFAAPPTSLTPHTSDRSRCEPSPAPKHHIGQSASPEQLADLVARTRAAFGAQARAAEVDALLRQGGEEGLTDAQLKR